MKKNKKTNKDRGKLRNRRAERDESFKRERGRENSEKGRENSVREGLRTVPEREGEQCQRGRQIKRKKEREKREREGKEKHPCSRRTEIIHETET